MNILLAVKSAAIACATIFFGTGLIHGQDTAPIDAVVSFSPGDNTVFGQSEEYFPGNVLGWPSSNGRQNVAETSPNQIAAIGLDGEIVLRWNDRVLADRDGVDFTIYENAFEYFKGIYAEPAIVSVSQDGIVWHDFPYDSLSLEGLAGISPTLGDQDFTTPGAAGGDSFDIAELGLESIRYIKLTDVTNIIINNPDHPNYDITLNGFDLDGVVGYSLILDNIGVEQVAHSAIDMQAKYTFIDYLGKVRNRGTFEEMQLNHELILVGGSSANPLIIVK